MAPRRIAAVLSLAASGLALVAASPAASAEEPAAERRVVARVDPRVELLSVVFRLAGNPEYNQAKIPAYARAVDERFGPFRGHAVVRRARELRRTRGVSYDAVMGFAVHLDAEFRLPAGTAHPARLDARWPADETRLFAEELAAFAGESDARGFFRSREAYYAAAAARLQKVLDAGLRVAWFDAFFGSRPAARFDLAIGLLNGGACYGPSVLLPDGGEELHCVLGAWRVDAAGDPDFEPAVVPFVVHEFCHSYANALVDARMARLEGPGKLLWPSVGAQMRRQAYGEPATMLRESLVRACVVRYRLAHEGEEAARAEVAEQHGNSFLWTGELAALLGAYEKARPEFPNLEAFMPRVEAFFEEYAKRFAETRARAPRVASMEPANGATGVDPGRTTIVVTFDRPMRDGSWAVVGGGPNFPEMKGKPSYDEARRVLTLPVALQPSWKYEFWLNRGKYDAFQSEEGVPLEPVRVAFETRAAAAGSE